MSRAALLLLLLASCEHAEPRPASRLRWYKANFHSHMKSPLYSSDDGRFPPADDFQKYEDLGYDHNVHSIHTRVHDDYEAADREWQKLRESHAALPLRIRRSLGCEVNVAKGPRYDPLARNLNHIGATGVSRLVPSGLPLKTTLDWIHALGGVAIVNHPGPPTLLHWEEGYWEAKGVRERIDAVEVYNGNDMIVPLNFEGRYREATHDLGMRIAAVTGSDTHGRPFERRIEITYVLARSPEIADVVEAVRARRTIAAYGFPDLQPSCRNLGEVVISREASLALGLGRAVERIELWANGKKLREWTSTGAAEHQGRVDEPTTFVWHFYDGGRRGTASAIWYRPQAERLADLTFDSTAGVVVRNMGDAPSGPFFLHAGDRRLECAPLAPAESRRIDIQMDGRTLLDIDGADESDERNNSRFYGP